MLNRLKNQHYSPKQSGFYNFFLKFSISDLRPAEVHWQRQAYRHHVNIWVPEKIGKNKIPEMIRVEFYLNLLVKDLLKLGNCKTPCSLPLFKLCNKKLQDMNKYFSTTSRSRMFRFIWNVIGANI